jgi:hypothetical protein
MLEQHLPLERATNIPSNTIFVNPLYFALAINLAAMATWQHFATVKFWFTQALEKSEPAHIIMPR